jgi:pimeloyl-ACP methyl ester carboxylesterase
MTDRSRRSLTRRRLRRWLVFVSGTVLCWLLASFVVAHRLTRRPAPRFDEPPPNVTWGVLEQHRFATEDGQEIGAWYAEGAEEAPAVLLLHGNKGSRRNVLGRAELMASRVCSALMISLRAHGDSTGDVNDIGWGARKDVVAAVEFLKRRRPGKPVVVLGVSLGSAAAAFAAEELGDTFVGYVLETPYQNLSDATRDRCRTYLPPIVDFMAYLGLRLAATVVLPNFAEISPVRAIDKVPEHVPVLVLAGAEDRLAPVEAVRAFLDRVRDHGRLEVFPGCGHQDLLRQAPDR